MIDKPFPPFVPHPLLGNPHAQTLVAAYLGGKIYPYRARRRLVELPDGDRLVVHDDCPPAWRPGDRTALLLHGLAGDHASPYMRRIAAKLTARGVRAFRLDLRACGAGLRLARRPYHSGRSDDAAAALVAVARWCPGSPTTLVGFSLGGNLTLKLLGELGERPCGQLDGAVAICPPIDLAACSHEIGKRQNRLYDRHFVQLLWSQLQRWQRLVPGAARADALRRPRTLWELDNVFTAPVCGFGTADNYYRQSSSASLVASIRRPTLIVAAADDPLIPASIFRQLRWPACVELRIADRGGHLGFIGRRNGDPDRRWMDWRVVEWIASR